MWLRSLTYTHPPNESKRDPTFNSIQQFSVFSVTLTHPPKKTQAVMWLRAFARPEWQNSWDYFINLSAADIPIVAMEHIEARVYIHVCVCVCVCVLYTDVCG